MARQDDSTSKPRIPAGRGGKREKEMTKQTRQAVIVSGVVLLLCFVASVCAFKHRQIRWWYWWWELQEAKTEYEKKEIIDDYEPFSEKIKILIEKLNEQFEQSKKMEEKINEKLKDIKI